MTGIVVVSHSRALAEAAADLALQMVRDGAPRIEIAAGIEEPGGGTALGTDAAAISAAIEAAADDQGVVVLMDLGSAILSAQTALEFLDPELEGRVHLTFAPLVEGLVGAVVTAASGADADDVAGQAEIAVEAKRLQLGV
ncbi:dihydroxyacetone kinase phosphoryl donor subunit DhaM [Brachybacterium phenoliresistens]|uniref:phosphoenolpyruvate--glycerone phosphotransferase n=1 Tax=Brachybacterium phenoliresistens TaxID=396014 RepID=Z9JVH6_9MICO|nr:dihydroxyacetone kinase phosphoryl donor subunit DhaM [Brachybacterium phenoliresistens]EWS81782.1 dihydroxyacetone kinase [Brachybacterium phenoliresistens]